MHTCTLYICWHLVPIQDTFLPHVEDGTITLLGATTENPSFQLNSALLSRCRVIVLEKLQAVDVETLLRRSLKRLGAKVMDDSSQDQRDGYVHVATIVFV